MLKRLKSWSLAASITMMVILMITPTTNAGDSAKSFRQQNGLLTYSPPAWFLEGYSLLGKGIQVMFLGRCKISFRPWAIQQHG